MCVCVTAGIMPGVGVDEVGLQKLTRRHAVKLLPAVTCSVEDAAYAIGELVGFQSVKAASRMNSAIVIFLDNVAKVDKVVESGVVIHDTFTPVFPLANPARRIMISNTPPFIKNEDLTIELSRYGRVISPIKMMMMGGKTRPEMKHVVCYRRQTFMVLKDGAKDLNLSLSFKVDGFNYIVFVTSETMKCFACGAEGHLARACPEDKEAAGGAAGPSAGASPRRPWGSGASASGGPGALASGEPAADGGGGSGETGSGETGSPDALQPAAELDSAGAQRSDETAEQSEREEMEQEQAVRPEENVTATKSTVTPADKNKQEKKKKDKEHNVNADEVVNEVMEEDMAEDKRLGKRKISECGGEEEDDGEEEEVEVEEDGGDEAGEECDMTPSQEFHTATYSLKEIKKFLKDTKGKAAVQVKNFFPDLKGFIVSVTRLKKMEDSFETKEVYRLNKFVTKARMKLAELNHDSI